MGRKGGQTASRTGCEPSRSAWAGVRIEVGKGKAGIANWRRRHVARLSLGMRPPTESMKSHNFRLPTCPLNLHVFVSRLSSIYLISLSITLVCPLPLGCGGRTIALTLISPSFLFLKSLGCGNKTLV